MRDIWTYPVSFPYGATTSPYTSSSPHRGEDRAAPSGTPIPVNGVVIGLVGTTGKSTGPHLHVQKISGGQVVHPKAGGATMPDPEVYETGTKSDIGNYVRIRDGADAQWSYFHLSEIKVGEGPLGDEVLHEGKDIYTWAAEANDWHQRAEDRLVVIHRLENEVQDLRKRVEDLEANQSGEYVETKVYTKKS